MAKKKYVLSKKHQKIHDDFIEYMKSNGQSGKGPTHYTESLERRTPNIVRALVDPSFTHPYDYNDTSYLQNLLDRLEDKEEWKVANGSHQTLKNGLRKYIDFLKGYIDVSFVPVLDNEQKSLKELIEGRVKEYRAVGYERNYKAKKECIKIYGCKCHICGFDFFEKYGEMGKEIIEVHHIRPICKQGGEYVVNPEVHLIPVCSNCHSVIHKDNNAEENYHKLIDWIANHDNN